ncbi:MAG: PilZ domain-containing protein [Succinivibrionaceae bacterium]|nr:PilZ domain-containing protein [Succinivibrionaceae bacterium]
MIEKRRYNRVAYQTKGQFVGESFNVNVTVIDLSIKGVLVKTNTPLEMEIGKEGTLTIDIDESIKVFMQVKVVRTQGCDIGLYCTKIDIESITHLRALIDLNLGNPNLLERDLEELIR